MAQQRRVHTRPVATIFLTAIYLLFLLAATVYKYRKPDYNWDLLAYSAAAISLERNNATEVHDIAYREARAHIPAFHYRQLTDTASVYRRRMAADPAFFNEQMPFYVIKPLYVAMVYSAYKSGLSLPAATFFPSVLAFFGIGLLLFFWLRRHLHIVLCTLLSILLVLATPLMYAASMATPDCLSAFFLLCAFYCIIERRRLVLAYLFLALAIFTRLDNVIVAFVILTMMARSNAWPGRIPLKRYLAMVTGLAVAYFLVTAMATRYGWSLFFLPSFYTRFHDTLYSVHTSSLIKDYILQRHSAIMVSFLFHHLSVYLAFALLLFIGRTPLRWKTLTTGQVLMLALIITIAIRAVVYTDLSDRYFVAYFLVIPVLLVQRIHELMAGRSVASS
jgi:hypothetical protein